MKYQEIQKLLKEKGLDGWLLYDFHGINNLSLEFLGLVGKHLTRRFFYWVEYL